MRFFTDLFEKFTGNLDMNIRIMSKDGVLTVQITPGVRNDKVKPIEMTGTPMEFDDEFFDKVIPAVVEVHGLITNISAVKESAQKAVEEAAKPQKTKEEKRAEAKKKPAGKVKKSKEPVVKETSIFDATPEAGTSDETETEASAEQDDDSQAEEAQD